MLTQSCDCDMNWCNFWLLKGETRTTNQILKSPLARLYLKIKRFLRITDIFNTIYLRSKNFNWLQNRRKTWVVSRWPSLYFLETPIWQSYCFWKSRLPICFQFSPWQKFPRLQSRSTSPRSLQNYFGLWFTRIWWFWTSKSIHRIPYTWRRLCGSRKFTYVLCSCKSSFYF